MKLQSIVSITCAVRPWRCHDWCATRSQPLEKKKRNIIWVVSGVKTYFLDNFFPRFFSSQRCLKHFSNAASSSHPDSKNKKTTHYRAFRLHSADRRMDTSSDLKEGIVDRRNISKQVPLWWPRFHPPPPSRDRGIILWFDRPWKLGHSESKYKFPRTNLAMSRLWHAGKTNGCLLRRKRLEKTCVLDAAVWVVHSVCDIISVHSMTLKTCVHQLTAVVLVGHSGCIVAQGKMSPPELRTALTESLCVMEDFPASVKE